MMGYHIEKSLHVGHHDNSDHHDDAAASPPHQTTSVLADDVNLADVDLDSAAAARKPRRRIL